MPDQPSPRRRFLFGLRTLMIGVTLLAALCAIWNYVEGQRKIVSFRKEMLINLSINYRGIPFQERPPVPEPSKIPWLRRILGDEEWTMIVVPKTTPVEGRRTIKEWYPEAAIKWQSESGRFESFSEDGK